MIRSTRTGLLVATAVPLVALALTACGSGNGTTGPTAPETTSSGPSATVNVATEGNLGKVLVDAQGRTLYLFQKDAGTNSECTGACATAWPPLRDAGMPTVGTGLTASKVGTTPRSDGKPQVTYNGHPLYLLPGRPEARRHARGGNHGVRRRMVRPVSGRKHGLRQPLEPGRRQWLLAVSYICRGP
jgi:predicted lipoprotein with Yx(FWY)xxD motif